ncbi:MAG: glycoside hydrolase family 127 protein [Treponema sp.]|jgi:hypothetical protein|nr:glycoside hydrolase family 127 protein [Treponema sp.]
MKIFFLPRVPSSRGITLYTSNRKPLAPSAMVSLPAGAVKPRGWIKGQLELMTRGMAGRLSELSIFLKSENNGWLYDGQGAWEEQAYFFRAFYELAAVTEDPKLQEETTKWIESLLGLVNEDGYWGPSMLKSIPLENGLKAPDLWPHMVMIDPLMSHYDRTGDGRVIPLLLNFFRWCSEIPDDCFIPPVKTAPNFGYYKELLKDSAQWMIFVQQDRAGDMIPSIYWLYNLTGESFLLPLADRFFSKMRPPLEKFLDKHVVHFAQRWRYFGNHYIQSHDEEELRKSEYYYKTHYDHWGQMPGGAFASDELTREGKTDPRQAFETCGCVELAKSYFILSEITGDTKYADRCEDVLFNTFPATHDPWLKSLHYLTAPNQVILDAAPHDYANKGRQIDYSPFELYRCCQHNAGLGWPSYVRRLWMAADGGGLAAWLYGASSVDALVSDGVRVHIDEYTDYPFNTDISFVVSPEKPAEFPLYFRIPSWAKAVGLTINGVRHPVDKAQVICIENEWCRGDKIELSFDAGIEFRVWEKQKGAVSVNYGPLSYSLRIKEDWRVYSGSAEWPEWTVFPDSPWNYGLIPDTAVLKKRSPLSCQPWTAENAPVELAVKAKKVPHWRATDNMIDPLPQSPAPAGEPEEEITLIPMGCARLRVSCFPAVK